MVGEVGIPWSAGRREGGAGFGARLAGDGARRFRYARTRHNTHTDRDYRQRCGSTRELLDEGRQLVVDHYVEIEECPGDVYHSASRQDGYTPVEGGFGSESLGDRGGNPVTLGVL